MMLIYLFLAYASFVVHLISIPLYMILTPLYFLFYKNFKLNINIFILASLFIWPILFTFYLSIFSLHNIDVTTEILAYIIHALSFILVSSFIYSNYHKYLDILETLLKIIFATVILDILSGAIFSKSLVSFLPLLEDIFSNRRDNFIPLLGLNIPRIQGFMSEPTHLGILFNIILFVVIISGRYKNYHLFFLFIVQITTISISAIPLTLINLFLIFKRLKSFIGFIFLLFLIISSLIIFYLLGDLLVLVNAAFSKLSGEGASGLGRIGKILLLLDLLKESMLLGKGIDYFVFVNGTNTGNYLGIFLIEGGLVSLFLLIIALSIITKIIYQNYGLLETLVSILFILLTLLTHSSPFPLLFFLPMIHFLSIDNPSNYQKIG